MPSGGENGIKTLNIVFIAKFYFSSNLVTTQSDIPTERKTYQYLTNQGPGQAEGASHYYVTDDNLRKPGLSLDKGEDRVDLRPLRDFLAALP